MPVNIVKNPEDEKYWNKAKALAARAGRSKDWPYIMGIFQKMTGKSMSAAEGVKCFEAMPASKLRKSMALALPATPRFVMSRWPGQVPNREAIEAMRMAKQEPPKWTVARMMAHDGSYLSPINVVDGIGLDHSKQSEWIGLLKKASAHTNELTFRQDIMGKMLNDKMDPASRQALFQRAMSYYRDMRKSMVSVVSPDDLLKSQGEGSRGGQVIGHTSGGAPIYDKSHGEMMRLHMQAVDSARAAGNHKEANQHMLAHNAHRDAIYLPQPGGLHGGSGRLHPIKAAHAAWDATHRAESLRKSHSSDRLYKSVIRRVRKAPSLGLPLSQIDDLVKRYGRCAVADTLEKACRDRGGLYYQNGVLKVR